MANERYAQRRKWRKQIAAYWVANPIEWCELLFPICKGNFGLAPAHAKNGVERFTFEDEAEVVAGCQPCHFHADRVMSKEDRYKLFRTIIEARGFTCKTCGDSVPPPLTQCSVCSDQVFQPSPRLARTY